MKLKRILIVILSVILMVTCNVASAAAMMNLDSSNRVSDSLDKKVQKSLKDTGGRSTDYETPEEYFEAIEELKATNRETQGVYVPKNEVFSWIMAGAYISATIAKSAVTGVNIDDNGWKLYFPTPVQPKAKEAATGQEINAKPGEPWNGPSDAS